ncbi:MAG: hypothetical protein K9K67_04245 [Bacteriovoracaceae bacterium]|nr:hypothetical protein [Bacteriovoracaceae bacterium]
MNFRYPLALFCTLILNTCAQEPSPVVAAQSGFTGIADLNPAGPMTKNAVVYKGSDFFGQSCGLAVSLIEENGEHLYLTKVNYKLHGETLPDVESTIYRFDLASNSYSDAETGNGNITLGAAILNDGSIADLNLLSVYESQGRLVYSLRVETTASSASSFDEALEKVVDDPQELAAYASTLDQISRIVFKINHAGHYDATGCLNLKLDSVSKTDFNVGHHDDHDHDHD